MGNFQGGGNRGGGFRGGNGGGFRGGNSGGRNMTIHKAICDECHKSCEVPFRPSGDKPIYCNECFSTKKGDDNRGGDRGPRRNFGDRVANKNFGNKGNQSFSKPTSVPANDGVSKQLNEMNSKLDRLLSAIEKLTTPKAEVKVPATVKKEVKKVVPKKPAVKSSIKKVATKKKK